MWGLTLSIVIPVVLIGYGVYLAVRMIRNRKRGGCCGGCAGCPYAGDCGGRDACRLPKEEQKHD